MNQNKSPKIYFTFTLLLMHPPLHANDLSKIGQLPGKTLEEKVQKLKDAALCQRSDGAYIYSLEGNFFPLRFNHRKKVINIKLVDSSISEHEADQDDGDECLNFNLNKEKFTGKVEQIFAYHDCDSLPDRGRGNLILGIVDGISGSLGVKSVKLTDDSSVNCEKNDDESSLALIHMFQSKNGQTWYESKGYRPKNYPQYRTAIDQLRNVSVNDALTMLKGSFKSLKEQGIENRYLDLKTKIEAHGINFEQAIYNMRPDYSHKVDALIYQARALKGKIDYLSLYQTSLEQIEKYARASNKNKLHEFFAWLWSNHCEKFQRFSDIIFPDESLEIPTNSYLQNFHTFFELNKELSKPVIVAPAHDDLAALCTAAPTFTFQGIDETLKSLACQ